MNTTIRQKPANQLAVKKIEAFLISLKADLDAGEPANFSARQKKFNVSNSTTAACKALQFIEKKGARYFWKEGEANRTKALLILDYFLEKSRNTMRGQIMPDFEPLTHTLGNIAEKLNILTVQNEVALKRLKQGNNGADVADLFRIEDQRLYIAGQIAGGIYDRVFPFVLNPRDGASVEETNRLIVEATDNLLLQLKGKPKE